MTSLDEQIRDALSQEAADHHQPADLAGQSILAGGALRRRRHIAMGAVAAVSCAALVASSLAIADEVGGDNGVQQIVPATGSNNRVPAWSTWRPNRVYGERPSPGFLSHLPANETLLASGTIADGTEFWIASVRHSATPIDDTFGFGTEPVFGDEPGDGAPQYRRHAPYFAIETMSAGTWDDGKEDGADGFWLIVVGQPDTITASYSADGHTWQPMDVQQGIAVVKVDRSTAGIPSDARLRLGDQEGTYVDGPVNIL